MLKVKADPFPFQIPLLKLELCWCLSTEIFSKQRVNRGSVRVLFKLMFIKWQCGDRLFTFSQVRKRALVKWSDLVIELVAGRERSGLSFDSKCDLSLCC